MFSWTTWASIYTPHYLWKKHAIEVCFAKGEKGQRGEGAEAFKFRDWKKSDKEKVINWVNAEYSAERTGIYFVGFTDCGVNPDIDVAIFYNKNNKIKAHLLGGYDGIASLGTRGERISGYRRIRGYVAISKSGMDKGTVIHEFGHIAGLMHEHEHPDAINFEPECDLTSEWSHAFSEYVYEPYDKDSVMNYCKLFKRGGRRVGLSPRDVELLKRLYSEEVK